MSKVVKTEKIRAYELKLGDIFIKQGYRYRVRLIRHNILFYIHVRDESLMYKSKKEYYGAKGVMSHFSHEWVEKIIE